MADKVNLEIAGVIENMSGFTTPGGERFPIFGEGGGQRLADELDVPLLGKVPLTMPLREQADAGMPLVAVDPDDPAAQAIRHAARGLIAIVPGRAADRAAGRWTSSRPAAAAAGRDVACRWPAQRRARARRLRRASPAASGVVRGVELGEAAHSSGSWSSAKHASTGQASTQASQSMHSSGSM